MLKLPCVCICVFALACTFVSSAFAARTVGNHLTSNDLQRLQKVFVDGLSSNDLQSIYYSALNIEPSNAADRDALCKRIQTLHLESKLNEFEKDFYLVGSHKALRCTQQLPEALLSKIYSSLKTDLSSSQEIYYRIATHKQLGVHIDEQTKTKLLKTLQDLLKKDDTLSNLGYAFHVASDLNAAAGAAAFVLPRIEDALVQADEVDGKMLQFEGGLSITALIVNGALRLSKANNKPVPISAEQAVKFANYFLNRRSVQVAKGAHLLIEALKTLSEAQKVSPICIQIIGKAQLAADAQQLSIGIVNLLGKALTAAPQNVHAKLTLKSNGNTVLSEKLAFKQKSSDKTTFVADLSSLKPQRGIYLLDIAVDADYTQQLQFKVLGRVKVQSLEIGIAEADASASVQKRTVSYPQTLPEAFYADNTQKVLLKTVLWDEHTSKPLTVHQVFVRLHSDDTQQEIIFIAEQDSSRAYKFDMDVGSRAADFSYRSGLYKLSLIVGDASLSNSFDWHLANVQLKFAGEQKADKKIVERNALPEIAHQFRQPEKRPARLVSDIFTGLCLTPLVLLFIFWTKLGINVSNFNFAPSTIGFHLGFGGILALYLIFWLQLNMFETLRLLIPLSIFTFLCGNRLLRRIYAQRVPSSKSTTSSTAASS